MDPTGAEITAEDVRALQVLQLALGAGTFMFWGAILFMSQSLQPPAADPGSLQFVAILSGAHIMVALSSWTAGTIFYQRHLGAQGQPAMGRLRAATILRLALYDGPALMGGVVCLLAVQLGVARDQPLVWLNAASTFVFLFLVLTTLPSKDRLETMVRDLRQRDQR